MAAAGVGSGPRAQLSDNPGAEIPHTAHRHHSPARSDGRGSRSLLAQLRARVYARVPGDFMQNTLNFTPSVTAEGVVRGAWGQGAMGYIDVRDGTA